MKVDEQRASSVKMTPTNKSRNKSMMAIPPPPESRIIGTYVRPMSPMVMSQPKFYPIQYTPTNKSSQSHYQINHQITITSLPTHPNTNTNVNANVNTNTNTNYIANTLN